MSNGPWYDTAQICLNGHVINEMSVASQQHNQKFCQKCGTATITACPSCRANIRGYYHIPGAFGCSELNSPKFCFNCGQPYPWTESQLQAAKELADEVENLTPEEKESLKLSIDDLVRNPAKEEVASLKFKKLVAKAGGITGDLFQKVLVNLLSETAKKFIWPS